MTNNQYVSSVDISSDLGAAVTNVGGNVAIQGQAVCNSASVSTDPNITAINNTQQCDAVDPTSGTYVYADGIGGNLSVANLAAGNTLEADSNASNMPVNNLQINHANVNAMTTATVSNVGRQRQRHFGSRSATARRSSTIRQATEYRAPRRHPLGANRGCRGRKREGRQALPLFICASESRPAPGCSAPV